MKDQKGLGLLSVLLVVVLIGAVAGVGWYVWDKNKSETKPAITNFDECVAAGNPIMESYPEQCRADGQTFTRELSDKEKNMMEIENETKSDLITEYDYENFIDISTITDLDKYQSKLPSSFVSYLKPKIENDKPNDRGCLSLYSIQRVSSVNISGGVGDIAADKQNAGNCGIGGAAAYWYLSSAVWNVLYTQDAILCSDLAKTTIYREFVPVCMDSFDSSEQSPNPNGSIDDADI